MADDPPELTTTIELYRRSTPEGRAYLDGYLAALEWASQATLVCSYGPPSSWEGKNPRRWQLPDPCSPRDASMHDNGCMDVFKKIREFQRAMELARG